MTGVVFGKPNAERLTDEELRKLLKTLIESGFCSVSDFRASSDCMFASDIAGHARSDDEEKISEGCEERYAEFNDLRFESVDEVVAQLRDHPYIMISIEQKLYDWTTLEGDYGYRLVPAVGTLNRQFLESVIDAAMIGYEAIGWKGAPFPDVWTFSVTYFGLDVSIERCPPDMKSSLAKVPKFEQPRSFLEKALGSGFDTHTMNVA